MIAFLNRAQEFPHMRFRVEVYKTTENFLEIFIHMWSSMCILSNDRYTGPAADWLVKAANEKLRRNFERIDEVTEAVKKVLEGVDMPTGEDFTASD